MSIFVIGLNHTTAEVALREKIYFPLEKIPLYLQDLLNQGCAREAVILSTCNRTDLYFEADDSHPMIEWFLKQTTAPKALIKEALYVLQGEAAVLHMMKVASGLDSMMLGETQILGQLKQAFAESCTAMAVQTLFHQLFQQIFNTAKEIRTTTAIQACPVSVASAAANFAKSELLQKNISFKNAQVVLVGAGDTTQLLIRYLEKEMDKPFILVNRNVDKAMALADETSLLVYPLEDLPLALQEADVVFSATGSPLPLITRNMTAMIMRYRSDRPLTFIDIAVPRDVDAEVASIPNVTLFCIDDLKAIITKNQRGREHAAEKALEVITKKSQEFIHQLKLQKKVTSTISVYRRQIENLCQTELQKAKQQLHQGMDASLVLDRFAHAFIKKLLHAPSVQLRQAGVEGRDELLQLATQLFSVSNHEVELL